MQQGIVPVAVPVLEEDAVQLVVHAGVRGAEVDGHALLRVWVDEEVVHAARLHGDLPVRGGHALHLAVDVDSHHPGLDAEVLRLELVEVWRGTLGPVGAVDQLTQVVGDGALHIVAVGLAEQEASSRWGLEEFCGEKTAESRLLLVLIINRRAELFRCRHT